MNSHSEPTGLEIAIIGMAGRFPGASSLTQFWENLREGRESIIPLPDEHLREQGVSETDLDDPDYLKVGGFLKNADHFDAKFFGYSPREAELLDPQQRLFLEVSWQALETAGYLGEKEAASTGVFAGAGMNGYQLNLYANSQLRENTSPYEIFISNDKDFLATRVSYKLNLTGPSISVQTACSSSLVAVHTACQSLLAGECDMALAGGVAISKQLGYRSQQGSIYSPDGHCRAFDEKAAGTVSGSGAGVVVLKRLEDALRDGDQIDAIIKGSAITNDGAHKVSYTAPQVDSQAAAIRNALTLSDLSAESISYLEAHGTGTAMGDPIEIAALTSAFREHTEAKQFCALGSVKTNIGHLDAAAGIAGLIKTVLSLKHQKIPASLHFHQPNPEIDFENSPFQVKPQLTDWYSTAHPRRAGVSSFGIGGTNAHVILEEAPAPQVTEEPKASRGPQLLPLSAPSPSSLAQLTTELRDHLAQNKNLSLGDVAFTLQEGRRIHSYRAPLVVETMEEAIAALAKAPEASPASEQPSLLLLFSGQGGDSAPFAPIPPECQKAIDQLGPEEKLTRDCLTLFAQQVSLAQQVLALGIQPAALLGHSLGEIAAACVAGVFNLEAALRFVTLRSRLMAESQPGAMIAAGCSPEKAAPLLGDDLSLAAHNAPDWVTLSGTENAILDAEASLKERQIPTRRLPVTYAFHSPSMDAVAQGIIAELNQTTLHPPSLPIISSLTGEWLTAEQATQTNYWTRQLRETVEFSKAAQTALTLSQAVSLEVGPSETLTNLAKQHGDLSSLSPLGKETPLQLAAALWKQGFLVNWAHPSLREEKGKRIPLPNTPFQRKRYWIAPIETSPPSPQSALYLPTWKREALNHAPQKSVRKRWLILIDNSSFAASLATALEEQGEDIIVVEAGEKFAPAGFRRFTTNPQDPESLRTLFQELEERETLPEHCLFLWRNPLALQHLALTLPPSTNQLSVLTKASEDILGIENEDTQEANLRALTLIISQESPDLKCRTVDYDDTVPLPQLTKHLKQAETPVHTALRGTHLWNLSYENLILKNADQELQGPFLLIGNLSSELAKIWATQLSQLQDTQLLLLNTNSEIDPSSWISEVTPAWQKTSTSLSELPSLYQEALDHSGSLKGVFLCSPTTNQKSAAPLSLLNQSHWDYNDQTKAQILLTLREAITQSRPEFVCVQSSLSAILGGVGLGAYAAANAQLDQLVSHCARATNTDTRWLSIAWDRVEAIDQGAEPSHPSRFGNDDEPSFTAAEAWTLTEQLISSSLSGLFVTSPTALAPRLQQWVNQAGKTSEEPSAKQQSEERPDLPNPYIAPRNDIEATIIGIWEEFLGLRGIGAEDNFFALGGHSLLAIQIIARLRETFPVEIELRHLVSDDPTPASMATVLAHDLPDSAELDDMASLLAEIQELSPQEAQKQLDQSPQS